MFFWNHIFVSQWNYTELVSNERGDQKDSISGLFWGKKYDKDSLLYIVAYDQSMTNDFFSVMYTLQTDCRRQTLL